MLKHLHIRNFTLIDTLDIDFYPGFSVITGETGAGKSIIIGAIGLLLGNRADAKQVKNEAEKCIVEATFDLSLYQSDALKAFFCTYDLDYEPECLLRREVNANGKSRAFINDTPVNLATLRELGDQLIDVHSQHQNLLLNKEDFQLSVVDIMAHDKKELEDYQSTFKDYRYAITRLAELKTAIERSRENEDFLRFQQNELNQANLTDGEQEELEKRNDMMSHAEEIKSALHQTDTLLCGEETGVVNQLKSIISLLYGIKDIYPKAKEMYDRLESTFIELKDIAGDISNDMEKVEFDPQQLNEITARLDTIYSLQQKYHVASIAELLAKQNDINTQLECIDTSDEELEECQKAVSRLKEQCTLKAKTLTALRKKSATKVEEELQKLLIPLGIPKVRFKVGIEETDFGANGADKVLFLFSANSSTPMQPVAQVASGGEIARVMLSLKAMISKAIGLPTIIFDEIDTGVSGRVAEQMACIMRDMGDTHRQVICITHLPQIAACGTTHYKVIKEETEAGTVSIMKQLNAEERINEIAQMLSGNDISKAAIDNAKTLLKIKN